MAKQTKLPPRSINIEFNGNSYEIEFPTNGQLIDIEKLKVQLSDNAQKSFLYANTIQAEKAYMTIEMIATFTILIPKLKKHLKVPLLELSPIDTRELISAYTEKFFPWYMKWFDIINSNIEDEDEQEEEANEIADQESKVDKTEE